MRLLRNNVLPESTQPADKPRFSLGALLYAVTILCIVFAAAGYTYQHYESWLVGAVFAIPFVVIGVGAIQWRSDLLVIGLLLLPLTCLFLPAGMMVRDGGGRLGHCHYNLRQIMLAIAMHESNSGPFASHQVDASGKAIHSWRARLLPEFEETSLAKRYSWREPWDGPNNRLLHSETIRLLHCPTDASARTNTSYVALNSKGAAWTGKGGLNLREIQNGDGLSNTACLVEVTNSGIHWLEPRDLPRPLLFNSPAGPNISSAHAAGGANVAMADGSVRFISNQATARELRALTTKAGKDNGDLPRE